MIRASLPRLASSVAILACVALATTATSAAAEAIHWKLLDEAQLKLDGKPPVSASVYQPEKKKESNLVLVLLGHRYLALDTKAKLVYLVFPTDLHAQGTDFESGDLRIPSRVIPSTDWIERDVGPAESIRLTLGDYGRVLDIELPHPLDLRRGVY